MRKFNGALPDGYDDVDYDDIDYEEFIGYIKESIKCGKELPEILWLLVTTVHKVKPSTEPGWCLFGSETLLGT